MFERRKFLVGEPPSPLATVASSTVSTCGLGFGLRVRVRGGAVYLLSPYISQWYSCLSLHLRLAARRRVLGVGAAHGVAPLHLIGEHDERAHVRLAVLERRVRDREELAWLG